MPHQASNCTKLVEESFLPGFMNMCNLNINCNLDSLGPPKFQRNTMTMKHASNTFNSCSIFSFSNSILFLSIRFNEFLFNSFLFKKRLQCIPSILPSPVTPMFGKFVSSFSLQDFDIIFLQRTHIFSECNRQVYIHYKIVLEQKRLSV